MDFTITVERAEEAATKLNTLSVKVGHIVTGALYDDLKRLAVWLEGEVKRRTPSSGAGTLRSSINGDAHIRGTSLEALISTPLIYGAPVEFGSKPHFPPPDALVQWAKRHPPKDPKYKYLSPESRAFLIARAISQRGTESREMFQKTWEENLPE